MGRWEGGQRGDQCPPRGVLASACEIGSGWLRGERGEKGAKCIPSLRIRDKRKEHSCWLELIAWKGRRRAVMHVVRF